MADQSLTPVSRDSLVQEIALGLRFDTAGQLDAPWETLVSCVARVSRLTCIKDTRSGLWATREEVGYYPCQVRHGAKILGSAIRAHWGIENRTHYVRDVTLGEDASRIRTRPGMMARIRSVDSVMAPSTAEEPPDRPVPAPRGTTGMPWAWAIRSVAWTSAVLVARTSARGTPGRTVVARSRR